MSYVRILPLFCVITLLYTEPCKPANDMAAQRLGQKKEITERLSLLRSLLGLNQGPPD